MACGEEELLVDLECGGIGGVGSSSCRIVRKALNGVYFGTVTSNCVTSGESHIESGDNTSDKIDKCSGCDETRDIEKRTSGEAPKKLKYWKPPRPPKGPVLNAADLKLVKELSEIAARKRARIERLKALRKMKETKRPSSTTSLTAFVITLLFFVIILFHGACCGSRVRKELKESPAPTTSNKGLISVQVFSNAPTNLMNQNQPSSRSFNDAAGEHSYMEQHWNSIPQEEGRDAG